MVKKNDINDIVEKIETLIQNKDLRMKIALNGVETSKQYSWNKTIDKVLEYYKEIANYTVIK